MSSTAVLPETDVILANQVTILQNQALILKNQEEIKRHQETLNVIVKNQEKILAALGASYEGAALPERVEGMAHGPGGVFTKKGG
ncbi:MAG: hypothetical protein LAN83_17390 [Acidobacteriia bacterium]|nr:hypothetical protein [Terriglobia bacterium]